jgi:two-component system response regulator HydG
MTSGSLLIVDDDRDFAEALGGFLALDSFESDIATTGAAAIEAAVRHNYDAILMDIGLPDRNGVECLTEIKKAKPEVYCLLLTGYTASELAESAIDCGAAEVLTKPVDPEDLLRRLEEIPGETA